MARRVVWTEPAWDDLELATEYIARDSSAYAAAFLSEVKRTASSLAHFADRVQIVSCEHASGGTILDKRRNPERR